MDDRAARDVWASFQHDPRDPAVASLRAADADRDIVHNVLTEAFADGRLDREEYDERTAATMQARTLGQLPPLVADLERHLPLEHVEPLFLAAVHVRRRAAAGRYDRFPGGVTAGRVVAGRQKAVQVADYADAATLGRRSNDGVVR